MTAADAMDFWAFAAGAANVIMQLSRPQVGYGVVESKVDSGNLLRQPAQASVEAGAHDISVPRGGDTRFARGP